MTIISVHRLVGLLLSLRRITRPTLIFYKAVNSEVSKKYGDIAIDATGNIHPFLKKNSSEGVVGRCHYHITRLSLVISFWIRGQESMVEENTDRIPFASCPSYLSSPAYTPSSFGAIFIANQSIANETFFHAGKRLYRAMVLLQKSAFNIVLWKRGRGPLIKGQWLLSANWQVLRG